MFKGFSIQPKDYRLKYISIVIVLSILFAAGVLFYWQEINTESSNFLSIKIPRKEIQKIWVSKQITQCAEEWQMWILKYSAILEGEALKQAIKEFYKTEKDITIYDIKYEQLEPQTHCAACDCLSDIKLSLLVLKNNLDYFLGIGFSK